MNGEQRGVCVTVPLQKGVRFPVQYNTTATHVQVHIHNTPFIHVYTSSEL